MNLHRLGAAFDLGGAEGTDSEGGSQAAADGHDTQLVRWRKFTFAWPVSMRPWKTKIVRP
jgi:hypothetical protein